MIQVLLPTQHTINFSGIWLDNSGYLVYQWQIFVKEKAISSFKKLGRSRKVTKVGKVSGIDEVLKVEEKRNKLVFPLKRIIKISFKSEIHNLCLII